MRLGVLRVCRRYFAVSLVGWKDKDAQRVAAQVSNVTAVCTAVYVYAERIALQYIVVPSVD